MPYKAEEYRVKATECAELALKTKDPQSKRVLQLTAEHGEHSRTVPTSCICALIRACTHKFPMSAVPQ